MSPLSSQSADPLSLALLANLGDILISDRFLQFSGECTGKASLFAAAELGSHKLIVNVDAHVQVGLRATGLGELDHDGGGGTKRKRSRGVTNEALADQLKQALIRPEHEVLWVLCASSALKARLTSILLVEDNLSGLRLVLLHPFQGLVLDVLSQKLG